MSLSEGAEEVVRRLVSSGWFATEVAAFQAAIAVALARDLTIDRSEMRGSTTTKFNRGTLDPLVVDLVSQFSSSVEQPYETANMLAEAGLRYLGTLLEDDVKLTTALGLAETEPSTG